METLSSDYQAPTITTDDELEDYLYNTLGIRFSHYACCPQHTSPWQVFSDCYFARYPVIVWLGSRGLSGKSFLSATLSLVEAITLQASVVVLGGSESQSQGVQSYQRQFWQLPNVPRDLLAGEPGVLKTTLVTGKTIEALPASSKAVRGPHPERLRGDEIDEMDIVVFNAAMGETYSRGGVAAQTLLASTHQYPNGTFTEVLKRATERGWPIYQTCYKCNLEPHGWLTQREVDRKRLEVDELTWHVEYDLQAPVPQVAQRFFDMAVLLSIREGIKPPLEESYDDLGYTRIWLKPIVGHKYVSFMDIAAGYETPDNSVCDILDARSGVLVATICGHYPPEMLVDKGVVLCKQYNSAYLAIEANGLLGNYAIKKASELGYTGPSVFYYSDWEDAQRNGIMPTKPGYYTGAANKGANMSRLREYLAAGAVTVYEVEHIDEMSSFVQIHGRLEAASGYHDDRVMTLAGANYLRSLPIVTTRGITGRTRTFMAEH